MMYQRIHTNDSDTIVLPLYIVLFLYHMTNRGTSYRTYHPALPWHSIAGTVEIILYYLGFRCSLMAVVACFVHSWTALMLVKNLQNGYPPLTRPAYQAGAVMRPAQMLYAYYTQSPADYHDALMPIHSFVYTRVLIFLMGTMGPTPSFKKNVNSRFVYSESILGGALIAVSHSTKPEAIAVYASIMHMVGKVSLWARRKHDAEREQGVPLSKTVRLLSYLGFITRGKRLVDSSKASSKEAPEIGHLYADRMGHSWASVS
ncbi:hypothetical protein ATEIFO6365_0009017400 [Aspergillus terreus]|uniref:Uncharacterized protein n=1 Tax=Aspergillus terreus TaxID=33178 RepID=A0A5M3Z808_ASPTE|nr:hypothetical protein ATETN484_0011017400 [Aspergillus terreus]GFF18811.1 hypothetical protein ATEIFO6365_0009017400 [Aspergillus terreus]